MIYLLEWPKSKIQVTPKHGENVEQQELSFIANGNAKWSVTLEDSLAVSYKTKHILSVRRTTYAPRCLPKGFEIMSTQKPACDVYSCIHSCPNLEATHDVL